MVDVKHCQFIIIIYSIYNTVKTQRQKVLGHIENILEHNY